MPNHYGGGSNGPSNRSTRRGAGGVSRRGGSSVGFGPNASQATMQP